MSEQKGVEAEMAVGQPVNIAAPASGAELDQTQQQMLPPPVINESSLQQMP